MHIGGPGGLGDAAVIEAVIVEHVQQIGFVGQIVAIEFHCVGVRQINDIVMAQQGTEAVDAQVDGNVLGVVLKKEDAFFFA